MNIGRKRKTTPTQDQQLVEAVTENAAQRRETYRHIQKHVQLRLALPRLSITTIQRRLKDELVRKWIAARRIKLTDAEAKV